MQPERHAPRHPGPSGRRLIVLVLALVAGSRPASAIAQTAEPAIEVSIGGLWNGGYSLGARPATLTRNEPGGSPYVLFDTESRIASGAGLEARLGWRLGRSVSVEAGGSWSRAGLTTHLSGDVEDAPDLDSTEQFTQYVIDGAVVVHLTRLAFGGRRGVPFVEAGAGYLRQLYEGNTLVETGAVYHAGGGVHVWLRSTPAGWLKRLGVRVDGRVTVRTGGIDLEEDARRTFGTLAAGLALGF